MRMLSTTAGRSSVALWASGGPAVAISSTTRGVGRVTSANSGPSGLRRCALPRSCESIWTGVTQSTWHRRRDVPDYQGASGARPPCCEARAEAPIGVPAAGSRGEGQAGDPHERDRLKRLLAELPPGNLSDEEAESRPPRPRPL